MDNPIPEQPEQWDDDMTQREREEIADDIAAQDDESDLLEAEWCDEIDESDFEDDGYDEEEFNFERMWDDVGDQDWG